MSAKLPKGVRKVKIWKIPVVVDVENPLSPALTLDEFKRIYGKNPEKEAHRIISIEVLVCPEDSSIILPTQCSACPRFIRRVREEILCKETG